MASEEERPVLLAELLKRTPVMDVPLPKKQVITVQHDADVMESFKTLVDEHILSAPVLENGRFVGFLDMKDLTHFVVFAVDEARKSQGVAHSFNESAVHFSPHRASTHHVTSPAPSLPTVPATPSLEEQAAALAISTPLRDAAPSPTSTTDETDHFSASPSPSPLPSFASHSHSRPFLETAMHGLSIMAHKDAACAITNKYLARRHENSCLPHTESLYSAACILARGAHRIAILDAAGQVVNIISQSSIVAFLSQHSSELRSQLSAHFVSEGLGTRPVVFVSENESAYNVFRLMADKNLSGVPIVDEDGLWFGNTSGSDLKMYIAHPSLDLLDQPISSFLSAMRQTELAKTRAPTIGVRSTASLWDVVQKLAATKIHRLFVADPPLMKPEAVISLTDLLRHLLPEAIAHLPPRKSLVA